MFVVFWSQSGELDFLGDFFGDFLSNFFGDFFGDFLGGEGISFF